MTLIKENKIQCRKCHDVIESTFRWDYQTCSCGNCSVDGGHDYLRRTADPKGPGYDELITYEETQGE